MNRHRPAWVPPNLKGPHQPLLPRQPLRHLPPLRPPLHLQPRQHLPHLPVEGAHLLLLLPLPHRHPGRSPTAEDWQRRYRMPSSSAQIRYGPCIRANMHCTRLPHLCQTSDTVFQILGDEDSCLVLFTESESLSNCVFGFPLLSEIMSCTTYKICM